MPSEMPLLLTYVLQEFEAQVMLLELSSILSGKYLKRIHGSSITLTLSLY